MHISKESIKMTEMWLWCKILNFIIDADEIVFWAWIIKMGFCKIVTLCSARQQLKSGEAGEKAKGALLFEFQTNFQSCKDEKPQKRLGTFSWKKTAVLLDFV